MAEHETIADIIAEMRGMGNYQRYSGDHACALANRLEAAHRRERGDCAKLREALEELMKFTCNSCQERYCEEDVEEEDGHRIPSPCSVIIKARAALAASPRNCESLDCPTDCNDKVIHLSDRVHMLNTDSLGDHEWDDEVCSLEFVGGGGGDTWLIHGREGAAWACECEVLAPATEKEGGNNAD